MSNVVNIRQSSIKACIEGLQRLSEDTRINTLAIVAVTEEEGQEIASFFAYDDAARPFTAVGGLQDLQRNILRWINDEEG